MRRGRGTTGRWRGGPVDGGPLWWGVVVRRDQRLGVGGGCGELGPDKQHDVVGVGSSVGCDRVATVLIKERPSGLTYGCTRLGCRPVGPADDRGRRPGGAGTVVAAGEHVVPRGDHLRRRGDAAVRQRRRGRSADSDRQCRRLEQGVEDRWEHDVGRVVRRAHRRGPRLQPGVDPDPTPNRHGHSDHPWAVGDIRDIWNHTGADGGAGEAGREGVPVRAKSLDRGKLRRRRHRRRLPLTEG